MKKLLLCLSCVIFLGANETFIKKAHEANLSPQINYPMLPVR